LNHVTIVSGAVSFGPNARIMDFDDLAYPYLRRPPVFHPNSFIDGDVGIGSVIYSDVVLGKRAVIGGGANIGPGCEIGSLSKIGCMSSMKNTTIGERCLIGDWVTFEEDDNSHSSRTIVGDYVRIGDGVRICAGVIIPKGWSILPGSVVSPSSQQFNRGLPIIERKAV
jgi:UDP-3-O-[3-hydroxymyristoyl] glucosamine N-acyltransferase